MYLSIRLQRKIGAAFTSPIVQRASSYHSASSQLLCIPTTWILKEEKEEAEERERGKRMRINGEPPRAPLERDLACCYSILFILCGICSWASMPAADVDLQVAKTVMELYQARPANRQDFAGGRLDCRFAAGLLVLGPPPSTLPPRDCAAVGRCCRKQARGSALLSSVNMGKQRCRVTPQP
jgi:hypothetical protein